MARRDQRAPACCRQVWLQVWPSHGSSKDTSYPARHTNAATPPARSTVASATSALHSLLAVTVTRVQMQQLGSRAGRSGVAGKARGTGQVVLQVRVRCVRCCVNLHGFCLAHGVCPHPPALSLSPPPLSRLSPCANNGCEAGTVRSGVMQLSAACPRVALSNAMHACMLGGGGVAPTLSLVALSRPPRPSPLPVSCFSPPLEAPPPPSISFPARLRPRLTTWQPAIHGGRNVVRSPSASPSHR
eukprot:145812-Chlamydomonas_euryale.AAC.4